MNCSCDIATCFVCSEQFEIMNSIITYFTMSERSKDIPKLTKLYSSRVPIEEYPIYKLNNGKTANMDMLPDPPIDMALTHIKYDASVEPKFNATLHLDLEDPVEVAHFDKGLTNYGP